MAWLVVTLLICYLLGSIPFPVLVSRLVMGVDLRQHGTGNMGAANAGRVLGKRWFPVVLGLDAAKGAAAAVAARALLTGTAGLDPEGAAALGGLLAVIGHCYPVLAGFRGGLGLAVSAGALAVLSLPLMLTLLTSIPIFWGVTRDKYVGVAITAITAPLQAWYWLQGPLGVAVLSGWALVVLWVHVPRVNEWLRARRAG